MRELKFRVWDNLKKEWVSNKNIWRMKTDPNGIGEIHPNTFYWKQHPQAFTIQQYTGLKDKNGVEIFEGDIMRTLNYDSRKDEDIYMYGEVYYNEDLAAFMKKYSIFKDPMYLLSTDIFSEVAGNIFDNPELIK